MSARRGITFGPLPETEPPKVEARAERVARTETDRAYFRGRRTSMHGGLSCVASDAAFTPGEVVRFTIDRPMVDVTSFSDVAAQYVITARATAQLDLAGGDLPQPGQALAVRRGAQVAFMGTVRQVSIHMSAADGMTECTVLLEEL